MRFYRFVRFFLRPVLRVLFRPEVENLHHVPQTGGCLIVSNHRSFFDSLMQGWALGRPVRFVAKAELFERRWAAWLLVRLGAFPVRRGQSDPLPLETSRLLLVNGQCVGIFPEGTRVRETTPSDARRGAARLALETGVPIVPMGIVGTERGAMRRALWHRGERVRIRFESAVDPPAESDDDPRQAAASLTRRFWPHVRSSVEHLERRRTAAAAAAGIAGAAVLVARAVSKRKL